MTIVALVAISVEAGIPCHNRTAGLGFPSPAGKTVKASDLRLTHFSKIEGAEKYLSIRVSTMPANVCRQYDFL
jgi:hypothetical protein